MSSCILVMFQLQCFSLRVPISCELDTRRYWPLRRRHSVRPSIKSFWLADTIKCSDWLKPASILDWLILLESSDWLTPSSTPIGWDHRVLWLVDIQALKWIEPWDWLNWIDQWDLLAAQNALIGHWHDLFRHAPSDLFLEVWVLDILLPC